MSRRSRSTAQPKNRRPGPGEAAGPVTTNRRAWLFAVALVVAVLAAYQPAWRGGFLWDDDTHLLNNPVLRPGGLAKAWVPGGYINYWPLTFTAYWLQFKLWDLRPLGFHLVNLALHAASALLVWRVLVRLRAPGAMFAAALFALHPVNVETAAWITQLKGILSLVLALVAMLFYLKHEQHEDEKGDRSNLCHDPRCASVPASGPPPANWTCPLFRGWRYGLALTAFLLSALAKGMAVTLPVVLLACAWWQRGRIQWRDVWRVLPFCLVGAVMTGVEVWAQHHVAQQVVVRSDNFFSRAAVAGCAVWFYLGKLIWPADLCFCYPRWTIDERSLLPYFPGVMLVGLLAWAWVRRGTWGRPVVMLIVCYVALLLPALGFVNVYFMRYSLVSDHWQYVATIVPCAVFAGAAATLAGRSRGRPVAYAASLALLATLAVLTWRQSRAYADEITLYRAAIKTNPECWMAYANLARCLAAQGPEQRREALECAQRAWELNADDADVQCNLGIALACQGQERYAQAAQHFDKALELDRKHPHADLNYGMLLSRQGKFAAAVTHFKRALEINEQDVHARAELGMASGLLLAQQGKISEAADEWGKALEIAPDHLLTLNQMAWLRATCPDPSLRNASEAVTHARRAVELSGGREPNILDTLAAAYAEAGQFSEAVQTARKARDLAGSQRSPRLAEEIGRRITLYETGRAFRDPAMAPAPGSQPKSDSSP